MILNRSELISKLSGKFKSFTTSDIDYSVKKILEHISKSLYSGDRVEIRGFGTFSLHNHNSRTARNPKTGENVTISERRVVTFKSGLKLKNKLEAYDGKSE